MKWVRIVNGAVREIIPPAATLPSITHWYGAAFAAECVEAPDNVRQGWVYDAGAGTFAEPVADARARDRAHAGEMLCHAGGSQG